jgi:hypothetical protein
LQRSNVPRYREELRSNPAVTEIIEAIGDRKATLLYAAREVTVNHAVILAEFLKTVQRRPVAVRVVYDKLLIHSYEQHSPSDEYFETDRDGTTDLIGMFRKISERSS